MARNTPISLGELEKAELGFEILTLCLESSKTLIEIFELPAMKGLRQKYTDDPLRDLVRGYELSGLLVSRGSRQRLYRTTRIGREMLRHYEDRIKNPPLPPGE